MKKNRYLSFYDRKREPRKITQKTKKIKGKWDFGDFIGKNAIFQDFDLKFSIFRATVQKNVQDEKNSLNRKLSDAVRFMKKKLIFAILWHKTQAS